MVHVEIWHLPLFVRCLSGQGHLVRGFAPDLQTTLTLRLLPWIGRHVLLTLLHEFLRILRVLGHRWRSRVHRLGLHVLGPRIRVVRP